MPFLIKWPQVIQPGGVCKDIISNVDFAATWLEAAGQRTPSYMQGDSFLSSLRGIPRDLNDKTVAYHRCVTLLLKLLARESRPAGDLIGLELSDTGCIVIQFMTHMHTMESETIAGKSFTGTMKVSACLALGPLVRSENGNCLIARKTPWSSSIYGKIPNTPRCGNLW